MEYWLFEFRGDFIDSFDIKLFIFCVLCWEDWIPLMFLGEGIELRFRLVNECLSLSLFCYEFFVAEFFLISF